MKLNLGCGTNTIDGYLNVDIRDDVGANIVFDISKPPYPIAGASIEEIQMSHVLEHISFRQYPSMLEELKRILQPNGILTIKVPDLKNFVKVFNNYLAELAYSNNQETKLSRIEKFWINEGFSINGEHRNLTDFHISTFDFGYYWMLLKSHGFLNIGESYDEWGLVITARRP